MTSNNVDSELVWLVLAAVVGAYVFLSGFPKKINEWYYVIRLGKKHSSLPPGDMGWPFIGNMISFVRAFRSHDPDSFTNNLVHRYGHTGIYKTSLFGNPNIIVCSPELCRKVLTEDKLFEYGYPSSLDKLLGEHKSLHGVPNSKHKHLRKLLSSPINGHEALSKHIEEIVVSSMEEWIHNNSEIELLTELKKINFRVMTRILMGTVDYISESVTKNYAHLFQGLLSPLPIDVPAFTFHRALEARKILVNVIQANLDERRWHETTGHAAMWITVYLHDHPEVLQRVREEQVEIATRRPSSQKGYIMPKGWKVLVWNRSVHMNPDIYTNPNDFLPSRWDNYKPKAGSFIPFAAGSRTCPGADLSIIEMCIFMHHFLLNYRFERVNPKSPVIFPSPSPVDSCLARITKLPSP
ncbi:ENT-KAURENOIC ACID OXYDASE 1, cytochrome P450, family 88, subfamily A, polypeptide 3 [Hibiscus trionum]|uniref:ENT-KAURENOIC ACID OXYDASE 1, cytochrome P450, family 88, subfamily A, polypeptide 3 n=1 Tax=Hibiscus trionum TaxID=183268 RepID=A0A9W7IVR4_HIBTR|nr:ENT-KAURENOIC ACID OXYDASE 1, cytochrome P450, family 88, subfamily A, polypeptide 3 [Hibiscus trionum]